MSFFESVTQLPDDPIMALPIAFAADTRPNKVNLGIGSYKDDEGLFFLLPTVKETEKKLLTKETDKEYLPIDGDPRLIQATLELIFGRSLLDSFPGGIYAAQAVGGTSALRIGSDFLLQETSKTIFISTPTWPNHKLVFTRSGLKVHHYRYYDELTHRLDFGGLCSDISNMPPGSIILLHANCHNPTGVDPTFEQWKELSTLIKKQKIIPFFDFAYQGFSGTVDEDAQAIRYFASQGHEMLVANSFSKNFGLYCERVGLIAVLTHHKEAVRRVGSQIKQLIRANYSNPPRHGARVIAEILQSDTLRSAWLEELGNMRNRMKQMRHALISGLQVKQSDKDWSFLERQNGFFSFCGLTPDQVQRLIKNYAIYMPSNGRINIAGLNAHNLNYVIEALNDVSHA